MLIYVRSLKAVLKKLIDTWSQFLLATALVLCIFDYFPWSGAVRQLTQY